MRDFDEDQQCFNESVFKKVYTEKDIEFAEPKQKENDGNN